MSTIDHPAKYTRSILDALEEELGELRGPVLDMFAGTGRIHGIGRDDTLGIELEPEWAGMHPRTYQGDATALPYPSGIFGVVATSPCYGNRMADRYDGRDGSRRHTYRIALGHELSRGSAAGLQWGEAYRDLHRKAWQEAHRVLRPGGRLVINVADHIRGGQRQPVSHFHRRTAEEAGFRHLYTRMVATPGMRHGRNHELRTSGEYLIVLESPRCDGFTTSSAIRHQR